LDSPSYHEKARTDLDAMKLMAKQITDSLHRPEIESDYIERFCKNVCSLKVRRGEAITKEYQSTSLSSLGISDLMKWMTLPIQTQMQFGISCCAPLIGFTPFTIDILVLSLLPMILT
jgi:hypothetical protein